MSSKHSVSFLALSSCLPVIVKAVSSEPFHSCSSCDRTKTKTFSLFLATKRGQTKVKIWKCASGKSIFRTVCPFRETEEKKI